jgi:pimeloyl-ACP methyl ester carboxylesterase
MNLKKRKIFKLVWFSLAAVFLIWNWSTFQSRNLPKETFDNNEIVAVVENNDRITFKPKKSEQTVELIFFPGGLADPGAYAPLCREIAENGYTCHIIKMSFRLPQRDYQKISRLFDLKSGQYVIGGHSQGGKMAAQFVYENPGIMKGLFLLGTSHPRDISLSNQSIPTIKFYAENDGLASAEEVLENKDKLPINAKLILVEGGNHSQFGYLGKLLMDDNAGITLEEQQTIVLENLVNFLNEISDDKGKGI